MPISVKRSGKLDGLKRNLSANPYRSLVVGVLHNSKVATYGAYLEYGWVQRITRKQAGWFGANYGIHLKQGNTLYMPPRPFIRATAQAEYTKWADLVGGRLLATNGNVEDALSFCGLTAVQDIQQTIAGGGTSRESFARRSWITQNMGITNASLGGHRFDGTPNNTQTDKPLVRSGLLLASIGYELR